jgi:hypothetical protein
MSKPNIFSEEHLELIRKEYMRRHRPPREVASTLNTKFGTTFTARQVSAMVVERGWSSRRKQARAAATLAVNDVSNQIATAATVLAKESVVNDILAGQLRLGQKIMHKAELYVETAGSGKSLASATSAARGGVALARGAVGLDVPGAQPSTAVFNFTFARDSGSPFAPRAVEPEVIEAEVETPKA